MLKREPNLEALPSSSRARAFYHVESTSQASKMYGNFPAYPVATPEKKRVPQAHEGYLAFRIMCARESRLPQPKTPNTASVGVSLPCRAQDIRKVSEWERAWQPFFFQIMRQPDTQGNFCSAPTQDFLPVLEAEQDPPESKE